MKVIGYIFGIASAALLAIFGAGAVYLSGIAKDLPDHRKLAEWEPALMTRFYAYDGTPIAEYAKERRLYLPIAAIPQRVKAAFLAAEDKSFYTHSGIDVVSIVKAAWSNAVNLGSGQRLIGASTITQQLARNFLLSSDRPPLNARSRRRCFRSASSIAAAKQNSRTHLNDIYLGLGAYGIAARCADLFRQVRQRIDLAEAAYLAALPKGPTIQPHRHPNARSAGANWVIGQMQRNGFVSAAEASSMMARPLGIKPRANPPYGGGKLFRRGSAPEVAGNLARRSLLMPGFRAHDELDPTLQAAALKALRAGLVEYNRRGGFGGPSHISMLRTGRAAWLNRRL